MAGGTWIQQDKVRPGVYTNFVSEPRTTTTIGERGTAAFIAPLPWGEQLITIDSAEYLTQALPLLGYAATDERIRHITAATQHASKVIIYRLGLTGAAKATVTDDALTATAKYAGVRGNDLKIIVQENIDVANTFDVYTLLDNEVVASQIAVDTVQNLASNDFVVFTGTGALSATAGTSLVGGTDGTVSGTTWSAGLARLEVEDFNVLGIPSTDSTIKSLVTAWIKRVRDEGKKVVAVLENYPQADHEGIISLKNSIVLGDGSIVPTIHLLWEIAALEAGANVNQSLTYTPIANAVDVSPKYTNTEIIQALKNGEMVMTMSNGQAVIEQDINTFTSFTADKAKHFSKNRVMRVLDAIANDLSSNFERFFIGKVDNNADGRNLLKAQVISYMTTLQDLNAIQNFDSQNDIEVVAGNDADSVYVEMVAQPVDAIEKIYQKVRVM
ncbi:hypothetical protein J2Z32_003470 [Paenibacillus turicensis]|uniref:Phage tail sheath protein n=1 Tax=Paenibacillus turicensis TaxID=160487 RepID=A0ABS4FW43_9BACL|nr:phage tail sheath family protein [Paenibacillus turicensis]MBP1906806.1 hypothetical protein [Paenibacillus turicensis]